MPKEIEVPEKTETLAQTRDILKKLDCPVIIIHENGAFKYLNDSAIKILDLNKNDLRNLSIESVTQDRKKSGEIVRAIFCENNASSKSEKIDIDCFTGKYKKIRVSSSRIVFDRTLYGLIVLKPVLRSDDLESGFYFAGLSHDIRNILHTIEGSTNLLNELKTSDEVTKLAMILQRSVVQLSSIVNDIVNFEEIKFKPPAVKKESINIKSLIRDLISLYSGVASAKSLNISSLINKDVPENIYTDRSMLTSILSNLLINSLKFTEKGHVLIQCEMSQEDINTTFLTISVSDTGKGIPKDKIEYIFVAYQKMPGNLRTQYNGSGLGLALVSKYLKKLNATVDLSSELGKGSCFKIRIPAKEIIQNKNKQHWIDKASRKINILVIEDDVELADLIKESIISDRISVDVCSEFEKSLELIIKNSYDLILSDYHLGDKNGLILKDQLNKRNITIPFVLITGDSDLEILKKGFKLGSIDYIKKPFNPASLKKIVNHHIMPLNDTSKNFTSLEQKIPSCKLLFVDDSVESHLLISKYLGKTLCEIDFASDGTVAIEKFSKNRYDLIFLDLHMPIMDGILAAKKIREYELKSSVSKAKIVMMTAGYFDTSKLKAIGADLLLRKPFDKASFLSSIADLYVDGERSGK